MRYRDWRWFAGAAAVAAVASGAVAASLPCESSSDAPFALGVLAIVLGAVAVFLRVHGRAPLALAAAAGVAAVAVLGYAEYTIVIVSFLFRCGD